MYRACILITLLVAVSSATVKRGAPGHDAHAAHGDLDAHASYAAPVELDYSAAQQYTDYSNYYQPKETNIIERIIDSVTSFVDPLLKIDVVILGIIGAGIILLLSSFQIINLSTVLTGLESIFPTIIIDKGSARNMSPYESAARMLLGDEMERVAEIVHNAIDNVEKWKEL